MMQLDLRKGARVKIIAPDASNFGRMATVTGKDPEGSFRIKIDREKSSWRRLGAWWVSGALQASIEQLPIVNVNPKFKSEEKAAVTIEISDDDDDGVMIVDVKNGEKEECIHNDIPVDLAIVQSNHKQKGGKHEWSLFLAGEDCAMVNSVKWKLHNSFTPSTITLSLIHI
eukprot:TRINITY_DN18459_c0_g1_i1.p1 TRINITY_DN18459_c0_g1~~TRINITY_DN18459_c0_g1_i1.p1  ORF type:complete len:170 (-),score=33.21 TRINITY_DN18459_c0_g1_i1:37-546(-)